MAKKKRRQRRGSGLIAVLVVLLLASAALLGWLCINLSSYPPAQNPQETALPTAAAPAESTGAEVPTTEKTEPETDPEPETTEPEPTAPEIVSTATILSTGDLLMHGQLITDARQSDGSYDFGYIFPYITEYAAGADFAVANLETTLAGTAKPYSGNPMFNCPDNIVDSAKAAGFDLLLTANNHSYDSQQAGFERTIQVVREKGLTALGTQLSGDEPKYTVQEINGIRVGMICYTYEDSLNTSTPPALNYNPMQAGGYEQVNCFRHADPEPFYQDLAQQLEEMKAKGADVTILYIHWGQEYLLEPNHYQTEMAQRICDLGVDVIVGGHPHVVEPVALLTSSTDPDHKTVCLYSMGNAVSNQRLGKISAIPTAHTEDGVLFLLTFARYSDGNVYLQNADLIPTWVRAIDRNGNTVVRDNAAITRYEILPLEDGLRDSWQERFGLDDKTLSQAQDSWQRTQDIVGTGMEEVSAYLANARAEREIPN